ncbi:Sas10/Utp3/C1D family-domain-containing protein [Coprinopsis sp. MPI-PUGE-AT-0042]|nr:Sas10/Utp3/C1D family-domain-containing protein [Coprinopsis sp. MPI-PUGE-AT-0042]
MASAETSKIQSKLSALSTSLDEIESILEPLLSGSLAESIIDLEPLQQAKLQTVLPYAVYDLVFMYLKLEGVDPKAHPVIGELGRIKEYFDKISNTENPPQRRVEIDQAAAGRFIKAAITQAKWRKTAAEEKEEEEQGDSDEPEASTSASKPKAERVPVKVTTKMLERQRYEDEVRRADAEGEEEEGLEVFGEDENEDEGQEKGEDEKDEEGEGQAMHVDEPAKEQAGSKKKRARPVLDPFQGYGDETETTKATKAPSPAVTPSQSTLAESSESPKKKKKKSSAASTSGSKKKKAK